jgi:hypothetical protein
MKIEKENNQAKTPCLKKTASRQTKTMAINTL